MGVNKINAENSQNNSMNSTLQKARNIVFGLVMGVLTLGDNKAQADVNIMADKNDAILGAVVLNNPTQRILELRGARVGIFSNGKVVGDLLEDFHIMTRQGVFDLEKKGLKNTRSSELHYDNGKKKIHLYPGRNKFLFLADTTQGDHVGSTIELKGSYFEIYDPIDQSVVNEIQSEEHFLRLKFSKSQATRSELELYKKYEEESEGDVFDVRFDINNTGIGFIEVNQIVIRVDVVDIDGNKRPLQGETSLDFSLYNRKANSTTLRSMKHRPILNSRGELYFDRLSDIIKQGETQEYVILVRSYDQDDTNDYHFTLARIKSEDGNNDIVNVTPKTN